MNTSLTWIMGKKGGITFWSVIQWQQIPGQSDTQIFWQPISLLGLASSKTQPSTSTKHQRQINQTGSRYWSPQTLITSETVLHSSTQLHGCCVYEPLLGFTHTWIRCSSQQPFSPDIEILCGHLLCDKGWWASVSSQFVASDDSTKLYTHSSANSIGTQG